MNKRNTHCYIACGKHSFRNVTGCLIPVPIRLKNISYEKSIIVLGKYLKIPCASLLHLGSATDKFSQILSVIFLFYIQSINYIYIYIFIYLCHCKKKLAQLPAVDMQHAPANLSSKLHQFAYLDVLSQSLKFGVTIEFLHVNCRQLSRLFFWSGGTFYMIFLSTVKFLLILRAYNLSLCFWRVTLDPKAVTQFWGLQQPLLPVWCMSRPPKSGPGAFWGLGFTSSINFVFYFFFLFFFFFFFFFSLFYFLMFFCVIFDEFFSEFEDHWVYCVFFLGNPPVGKPLASPRGGYRIITFSQAYSRSHLLQWKVVWWIVSLVLFVLHCFLAFFNLKVSSILNESFISLLSVYFSLFLCLFCLLLKLIL
ncbi:hypothetical protein VP01_700g4 [Puccinia sorghi]|uniref:Uncharacterized protein n=1 Tax=Puccinia sorghi TaxID=27349 RepID=A0A0L6UDR5_9BASI|nr:hypothetical protein VP01_700g4 [Puccinia sorghi]